MPGGSRDPQPLVGGAAFCLLMRLFQNHSVSAAYSMRLDYLARAATTFEQRRSIILDDRYGACHVLKPVLDGDTSAFFSYANDEPAQRMWARARGLSARSSLESILQSQIEDHRTEVFYNLDPVRMQSDFVRRLPGCVRKTVAWRAAPSPKTDFSAYSVVVCNFPRILDSYRRAGCCVSHFSPAHDPVMDAYAALSDRPIDVLFVGGYSRHHRRRALVLEAVARLGKRYVVTMHLDQSKLNKLAESPVGWILPLWRHKRPRVIRSVARAPVFGRALYQALASAKVVLNGAVDMAGDERGNMRCFEAMGCGAAMVSDAGIYPEKMDCQTTMKLYRTPTQAAGIIEALLHDRNERLIMAARGHEVLRTRYTKDQQWREFCALPG